MQTSLRYNPHLWSEEELAAIFVVRFAELKELTRLVRRSAPESVPQHILITGQRGMGKTTLLRRLALEIKNTPDMAAKWFPLTFPEEQYTVSTLAELWRNVLDAFLDQSETDQRENGSLLDRQQIQLEKALAALGGMPPGQQEEEAFKLIREVIHMRGQGLVLLVDSTDLLFSSLAAADPDDKTASATALWRLRQVLSHEPGIFWIGSSYLALESSNQYQGAFHDFFKLLELRPLAITEMQKAMLTLSESFGMGATLKGKKARKQMEAALKANPARLQALRILTGGNPRTTVMLYDLFASGGSTDIQADLNSLLDIMTPLYKSRMESLFSDQARKILAHLMEAWEPTSAKDLSEAAGIAVTTISGQLSRLEAGGYIEKCSAPGKGKKMYQVSERFFNIWYLMRLAPRRFRLRFLWLVGFMRIWFSEDELQELSRERITGLDSGKYRDVNALEYTRVLAQSLPAESAERAKLEMRVASVVHEIECQAHHKLNTILFDFDSREDQFFTTLDDYWKRFAALDDKLAKCAHTNTETAQDWIQAVKGSFSLSLGEKERVAEAAATLSQGQYEELMQVFAEEREKFVELLGPQEAEALRHATLKGDFFPDFPDSQVAYKQIVAAFIEHPTVFWAALSLWGNKHQDEQVAEAYHRFFETDHGQGIPTAWNSFGNLLGYHLKCYAKAEKAYRKAIELDQKYADPWNGLGNLLTYHLKCYAEAEKAYKKAIELDQKYASPWNGLGNLLKDHLNRHDEAEKAYKKAIELDQNDPYPWNDLGNLLTDLKRYDEAEKAYRKAIELDPDNPYPPANYARLLLRQGCSHADVSPYCRQVLDLCAIVKGYDPAGISALQLQAHLCLGNTDMAIQALDKLAEEAVQGNKFALWRIKEQVRKCHPAGLGQNLRDAINRSFHADFLRPFSLVLEALEHNTTAVFRTAAPEVAAMAEKVYQSLIP
ncbi:tetratricopeptide repeat protein [Desulfosarcina sp. OttesenSCG-928-A07]|nr:tetratricopeptide repeat protein [Desulfosarcina sp. OttesenSCG-928-G17]MDL2329868.1 tetratricopeptide repeat protein [Desulfosarcina sp. OttesenSCG-928-A07]